MKISIVTISYNQAQFLERAILSVLDQNYQDLEYIVVDPGSTDGSREIIERYRDKIMKIVFEPDSGAAEGLNKGFTYATGKIFGFLNSDDVLLPGALKRVENFFLTYPDIDVVSGNCLVIDEFDHTLRKTYSDRFSILGYVYGTSILIQPSTFFREKIFLKTQGFNVANRSNWDGELFVDMHLQGAKFALIKDFLSAYRLHEKSITASGNLHKKMELYHKAMFKKIMGRERKRWDDFISHGFRLMKHLRNPTALYERIAKGPIYKRHEKKGNAF